MNQMRRRSIEFSDDETRTHMEPEDIKRPTFGPDGQVLEEEEDPGLTVLVQKTAGVRRERSDQRPGVRVAGQGRDGRRRCRFLVRRTLMVL